MSRRRVLVIPVIQDGKNKPRRLVMVTKRRHGDWIVPGGKLEQKLSKKRTAALEAFEEAGVVGKLEKLPQDKKLVIHSHSGKARKVDIYGLQVRKKLARWPERKQRKRRLVKASQLKQLPLEKPLRKAIQRYLSSL